MHSISICIFVLFSNLLMGQDTSCKYKSVLMYDCWDSKINKELKEPILLRIEYYNGKEQKITNINFDRYGYLLNTQIDSLNSNGEMIEYIIYDSDGKRISQQHKKFDSVSKRYYQILFNMEPHKCNLVDFDTMECIRDKCGRVIQEDIYGGYCKCIVGKYRYIYK